MREMFRCSLLPLLNAGEAFATRGLKGGGRGVKTTGVDTGRKADSTTVSAGGLLQPAARLITPAASANSVQFWTVMSPSRRQG